MVLTIAGMLQFRSRKPGNNYAGLAYGRYEQYQGTNRRANPGRR